MSRLPLLELHHQLVNASLHNDVGSIEKLITSEAKDDVINLILGNIAHSHKTKYGKYRPGDYLYIACENNCGEIVDYLLSLGVPGNEQVASVSPPRTPLSIACRNGHVKVVQYLHFHGICLHPKGKFRESPIYISSRYGHIDVLKFIVENVPGILMEATGGGIGTSPHIEYTDIWANLTKISEQEDSILIGNLLLYIASILQYVEIIKYLVRKGVSLQDFYSNSFFAGLLNPLSASCKNENEEITSFLVKNKAEIKPCMVESNPEFIGKILNGDRLLKVTAYKRSHSCCRNGSKEESEIGVLLPLAVYWDSMGLPSLHRCWLDYNPTRICRLDIHNNKIECLPLEFFTIIPNLEDLDISCNKMSVLPSKGLVESRLRNLVASNNNFETVPLELFLNQSLGVIDISHNKLYFLPPDTNSSHPCNSEELVWNCPMLTCLKCSYNMLTFVPKTLCEVLSLQKLFLNNNRLARFDLSWSCPLKVLDLSANDLNEFGSHSHTVWMGSLQSLSLSHNNLKSLSSNISLMESLQYLDLSHNCLRTLPPPCNWKTKVLYKLDLSHNKLYATIKTADSVRMGKTSVSYHPMKSGICELPSDIFGDCLQVLNLNDNCLEIVPPSVCQLKSLSELDIGNNEGIRTLPFELGRLKNIWNLRLTNLNIPGLPFHLDDQNHAKTVIPYLRRKLRKSKPFNHMKLMVVGWQGRGKTTLIATIQGNKLPPNIATDGVNIEQWKLSYENKSYFPSIFSSRPSDIEITFSSWDLAGQQVYYATHQCFLTKKTLYLTVFNVEEGVEGVNSMESWLLNIQARAPKSKVIIIGTHIDKLPSDKKSAILKQLDERIYTLYYKKGFPLICERLFVSNVTEEGLATLRDTVMQVAEQIIREEWGWSNGEGKTAPLSYIQLYDSVVRERDRRRKEELLPILTLDEMFGLVNSNPDNDIFDVEELIDAAEFLHENGILLHFKDQLRELNTLFFIDPSWLCNMLALVVTVKQKNPYVSGGYLTQNNLRLMLKHIPESFRPQYLQLLERFEIVLCLSDSHLMIPCMLPVERPVILKERVDTKYKNDRQYIARNYHMSYIPAGFWSRIIARIIAALHKWRIVPLSNSFDELSSGEKGFSCGEYSTTIWREGLIVHFTSGYILVESFDDMVTYKNYHSKGIAICIWSDIGDFSTMGFIADHIDSLITEWYPGLENADGFGHALVQRLIPCPLCISKLQEESQNYVDDFSMIESFSATFRDDQLVRQFSLQMCAIAALNYKAIYCDKHPDEGVPLDLVVPDIMLTDLPTVCVINEEKFEFTPCVETKLGEGGAGEVYHGVYDRQQVAVKQLHSSSNRRMFDSGFHEKKHHRDTDNIFIPSVQSLEQELEDSKVIKAFWDLRQEVAVLCRLKHQNIIKFIGVSRSPFCFILELAPLGSLWGILSKKVSARNEAHQSKHAGLLHKSVLGRSMTHKIALQVANALEYLHASKIIYRDLKSDNILVWSLQKDALVNIKLSDYGISAFNTPQGVIGEEGTPCFQAPEVRYGSPYDTKVDIFSYGIWLYELISGLRPYRNFGSPLEMRKAICRGERPSLRKEQIDPCLPYLELLMKDCWQEQPYYRPTSPDIVSKLKDVKVLLLQRLFPMEESCSLNNVTCIIPWNKEAGNQETKQSHLIVWRGKGDDRRYNIFNLETEVIEQEILSTGTRVNCMVLVCDLLWLGTEGKLIEVFKVSKKTRERTLLLLWTYDVKDHVLCLLVYKNKKSYSTCIFASLANGTLLAFHLRMNGDENGKDSWTNPKVLDLPTEGRPAKCMCLTRDDTELWVGSGKYIVIISPESLGIVVTIEVATMGHCLISAMVTDNQFVWMTDWRKPIIKQWDVKTRTVLYNFYFHDDNLLQKSVLPPKNELTHNSEFDSQSSAIESSFEESSGSNASFAKNYGSATSLSTIGGSCGSVDAMYSPRHRAAALSRKSLWVTSLLYEKGSLWVGRASGDIVIVDVVSSRASFGNIIAQLGCWSYELVKKSVSTVLPFGNNRVVSLVRVDTMKRSRLNSKSDDIYELLVYDVWSGIQIKEFYKNFNKGSE